MIRCATLATTVGLAAMLVACGSGNGSKTNSPSLPASSASPPASGRATSAVTPASGRVIDLANDKPLTTIEGADTGDFFNDLPALAAGDVNGDGLADLLIGARFGDGPGNSRKDAGEAYVMLGRKQLPDAIDVASGQQDMTIYGAHANDNFGWFGLIADVNGDGLGDLVISGAIAARPDGPAAGVVYVVFGKGGLGGTLDLSQSAADVTILGPQTSALFGDSMAAGDVNGDGLTDLIIGSTFARRPADRPSPNGQAGAAYIIYGRHAFPGTIDMAKGEYDVAVYGAKDQPHSDEVGNHVAAGDLNSDGMADVVIDGEAADGPNNSRSVAGDVYVIYGSSSLKKVIDLAGGEQDAVFYGAEVNDTLGFNLAVAPVGSGGENVLAMTARLASGPGDAYAQAGEVHLVRGKDVARSTDLANNPADDYLYGAHGADMLGNGLAAADVDGDGVKELLVGAPGADGAGQGQQDSGEMYAIDVRNLRGAVSPDAAALRLTVYGALPDDGFGASLAAGDFNGDGKPEIAALALRSDGPAGSRKDAGEVYIFSP